MLIPLQGTSAVILDPDTGSFERIYQPLRETEIKAVAGLCEIVGGILYGLIGFDDDLYFYPGHSPAVRLAPGTYECSSDVLGRTAETPNHRSFMLTVHGKVVTHLVYERYLELFEPWMAIVSRNTGFETPYEYEHEEDFFLNTCRILADASEVIRMASLWSRSNKENPEKFRFVL